MINDCGITIAGSHVFNSASLPCRGAEFSNPSPHVANLMNTTQIVDVAIRPPLL